MFPSHDQESLQGISRYFKNVSTNTVTFDGNGSEQIDNAATASLAGWEGFWLRWNGTRWLIL